MFQENVYFFYLKQISPHSKNIYYNKKSEYVISYYYALLVSTKQFFFIF